MFHYGFNFQWMYHWEPGVVPQAADERALDCMVEWGFDFVRLPTSYWFWTTDFDYLRPDEKMLAHIDRYLAACQARELHLSLNMHRVPGYCINGNEREKHNLWLDKEAQDGFVFQWEMFARRYRGVPNSQLSFDLVNEPPAVGQYGMSREHHAAVIRRTVAAIRDIDPEREIVIDGLDGGHMAMPELADLGVIHSGRGYQPQNVTHYLAEWWPEWEGQPEPTYPNTQFHDQTWNREVLYQFYRPWRDVQAQGVQVHIGEFGCYNKTPNDVALRWFADVLSVFQQCGWGYALWEFAGPFGIVEHGRTGTWYEKVNGYAVDRELLDLLRHYRLTT